MKKILLFQSGNLGDVVITQPLGALLKRHLPGVHLTLVGQDYVADLVRASPQFDAFISMENLVATTHSEADIILFAKKEESLPVAMWASRVGIPLRVAKYRRHDKTTSYCNKIVRFQYPRLVHHAQYHLQLLRGLDLPYQYSLEEVTNLVGFKANPALPLPPLDHSRFNLIIHPGTHGHTREWPLENFRQLIDALPAEKFHLYLTGSAQEAERYRADFSTHRQITNLMGELTLPQFLQFITRVDGLVANATGPLHIAAAAGIFTLGLYPARKNLRPKDWAPLGPQSQTLVHPKKLGCFGCTTLPHGCACMQKITVNQVKTEISRWLSHPLPSKTMLV
jgi:heptosyltransferase-3